ncbi:SHOCT domain-containing protein [Nocardioides sp. CN2-186]|uniref:SHOCT domain-containing protein n=1 Tax=Nocardioides tweenelious TaxID=3156607 RepID=UPI0032B52495
MPRLLGTMARTAVIAGTATHVSNNVSRRQANRWSQQADAQAYQQQQAAPPPAPAPVAAAPAASGSDDMIEKLQKLGALRDQGILTDAEFEAQKAKVLAGL